MQKHTEKKYIKHESILKNGGQMSTIIRIDEAEYNSKVHKKPKTPSPPHTEEAKQKRA